MKWSRTRFLVISLATLALSAFLLPNGSGGQKSDAPAVLVEAKILVIKPAGKDPLGAGDDFVPTHLVLLKSPAILERAVKKGKLASLKSLAKADDPVAAIQAGLSVAVEPGTKIITLKFRGVSEEDGAKILSAVVDSYQEFLDVTSRNVSDQTLELIAKVRDILKTDLIVAEEAYLRFRIEASPGNVTMEHLKALESKRTELLIREAEAQVEVKRAEGDPNRPGLKIEAHVWAAKIGFDKLPESVRNLGQVEAYKEHLKEKRELLAENLTALNKLIDHARQEIRSQTAYQSKDEHLRTDLARRLSLYQKTVDRLNQVNVNRDSSGFSVQILSAPKGTKVR